MAATDGRGVQIWSIAITVVVMFLFFFQLNTPSLFLLSSIYSGRELDVLSGYSIS